MSRLTHTVHRVFRRAPEGGGDLLHYLAEAAVYDFGLHVWQYDHTRWGPSGTGHAPGSLHYLHDSKGRGRAYDAYGAEHVMARYAAVLRDHHAGQLTELIHNPNASVKNGRAAHPAVDFWGPVTWEEHRNHVHVGI